MDTVFKEELSQSIGENADAFDRYEDFVSRTICKFSFRIDRAADFSARGKTYSTQGFMLGRFEVAGGGGKLIRSRSEIRQDARDAFAIYFPAKGDHELTQFSRTQQCVPGTLSLVSLGEPFAQTKSGDNDTFCFAMPRDFVDRRLSRSDELCARGFPILGGIGGLLYDTIQAFHRCADVMSENEIATAMHLIGDLAILALGSSADVLSDMRSVRASNLARAKRTIRARLGNANLQIGDVAQECSISLRYLHKLFRADGITVSEYVKQQRLERARYMLERAGDSTTVTEVSLNCGFSSASQFSTAFRRAFLIRPTDVMRRSRR